MLDGMSQLKTRYDISARTIPLNATDLTSNLSERIVQSYASEWTLKKQK